MSSSTSVCCPTSGREAREDEISCSRPDWRLEPLLTAVLLEGTICPISFVKETLVRPPRSTHLILSPFPRWHPSAN